MKRSAAAIATLTIAAIAVGCQSTPGGGAPTTTLATPAPAATPAAVPVVTPAVPASCHTRGQLPDPVCTPGAVDPRVTQNNIATTICKAGYTATVRPPVSYTNSLKLQQMAAYGDTQPPSQYEEDHLISLELGGSPTDPKNLWPEPGAHNVKDTVENAAHKAVCNGTLTLAAAQHGIATDWVALGHQLGVKI